MVCLSALACSCGSEIRESATPGGGSAPVQTAADAGVPATPSDPGSHPTLGQLRLSGVVFEATPQGSRPVEGAGVNAFVQEQRFGYSYWWAHGPTFSDSSGRFQLTSLADSTTVQLQVWKEGYVHQCGSPPVTMLSDIEMDAQLVPLGTLSALPESVPLPVAGFRSISGVILEAGAADTHAIPGAFVDFEPVIDFPAATTISDPAGRYLLCGIPEGEAVEVCAGADSVGCVSVPPGQSTGVDIVLPGP